MIAKRVRASIADATRAMSIHNSQPWRFVAHTGTIEVWLDPTVGPRIVDPDGRWAVQSVGAAVTNLELSLASRLGGRARVHELPDVTASIAHRVADPRVPPALRELAARPLAVVTWDADDELNPTEESLFAAIDHRFTSRAPFTSARIDTKGWKDLCAAGTVEDVTTAKASPQFGALLLELTAIVDSEKADDPAYLAELEHWVDQPGALGIPVGATGVHDSKETFPGRDFSLGTTHTTTSLPTAPFEQHPQLAIVHSPQDTPLYWLRAGRALQRLSLRATSMGLRVGILGQSLEEPDARATASADFSATVGATRCIQQVVRLGMGNGFPQPSATPRRALDEVLTSA